MEVVPGDPVVPVIWDEYKEILNEQEPGTPVEFMERFAYYERAKNAYCVVATGETAQYANIILKKGLCIRRQGDHFLSDLEVTRDSVLVNIV